MLVLSKAQDTVHGRSNLPELQPYWARVPLHARRRVYEDSQDTEAESCRRFSRRQGGQGKGDSSVNSSGQEIGQSRSEKQYEREK